MNNIVIIKYGALGDVVRTSYFAENLSKKYNKSITWITSKESSDILRFNPFIEKIIIDGEACPEEAYMVISLDDELRSIEVASKIKTNNIIGAYLNTSNNTVYSDNASLWFDMGLLSRHGKKIADELKKTNTLSHTEIFCSILEVERITARFYGNSVLADRWKATRNEFDLVIGVNPFSGNRWPSKEMPEDELFILISKITNKLNKLKLKFRLWIFADMSTEGRANRIAKTIDSVDVVNTGAGLHHFAAAIKACDCLVTADSLGLHLAISQAVPNVSFYAPTSSVEIDTFGTGVKVESTSADYCSYKGDADNSTLTAHRVFQAWEDLMNMKVL